MIWSKINEPIDKINFKHINCKTALGEYIIYWKEWKDKPTYNILLNNILIAREYKTLEKAKEKVKIIYEKNKF